MKLTTEQDWIKSYTGIALSRQDDSHSIVQFLKKHANGGKGLSCLELGSYPGPFLAALGDMGYTLNGVDYNEDNDKGLVQWLKSMGYPVGNFWVKDIFNFNPGIQFNLVCSFGLIEHFTNFDQVILQHAMYVQPGGQLIITTPNFRGWMQWLPHLLFDKENLDKHYLPSMYPQKWKAILEQNGFDIKWCGYFGGYVFWCDRSKKRSVLTWLLLRFTERAISQFKKIFLKLGFESSAFSAYCGIVALKRDS
jgi:SAM-dependent methyltransferase